MSDSPLSLSQLVAQVTEGFQSLFGRSQYRCKVEVSTVKSLKWRVYMELVEMSSEGEVLAKARGVIYESSVVQWFLSDVQMMNLTQLKGYQLLLRWSLHFHSEYGFSFNIAEISSDFTIWQLVHREQEIRQKLIDLDIITRNRQLPPPQPPYHIAVITSQTSEWLNDFRSILLQSQLQHDLIIYPTTIHGNTAAIAVAETMRTIYTDIHQWKKIDIVVILRGGGGSSGIVWQNDLAIAKGVCYMPVPVMIAIGHTSDRYILDEVCYFSAKTPSDAAHFLIRCTQWYQSDLTSLFSSIQHLLRHHLDQQHSQLDIIYHDILVQCGRHTEYLTQTLDHRYRSIMSYTPTQITALGYATLQRDGNYLTRLEIESLQSNDSLVLTIYNQQFFVTLHPISPSF